MRGQQQDGLTPCGPAGVARRPPTGRAPPIDRAPPPRRLHPAPAGESKWLQNNPPDLVPTEDRGALRQGCSTNGGSGASAVRSGTWKGGLQRARRRRDASGRSWRQHSGSLAQPCGPPRLPPQTPAARHVVEALAPYSEDNGGPLRVTQVCLAVRQRGESRQSCGSSRSRSRSRRFPWGPCRHSTAAAPHGCGRCHVPP